MQRRLIQMKLVSSVPHIHNTERTNSQLCRTQFDPVRAASLDTQNNGSHIYLVRKFPHASHRPQFPGSGDNAFSLHHLSIS